MGGGGVETPGRSWVRVKFFYHCAYLSWTPGLRRVFPSSYSTFSFRIFLPSCVSQGASHALASLPEMDSSYLLPDLSRWWLQVGCFLLFSFSLGFTQSCVLGSLRQVFLNDPALPLVVGNLMVWVQSTFQPLPQWLSSTWYIFFHPFTLPSWIQTFYMCLCKQCILFLAKFDNLCLVSGYLLYRKLM